MKNTFVVLTAALLLLGTATYTYADTPPTPCPMPEPSPSPSPSPSPETERGDPAQRPVPSYPPKSDPLEDDNVCKDAMSDPQLLFQIGAFFLLFASGIYLLRNRKSMLPLEG
jgi:hypothetical protein